MDLKWGTTASRKFATNIGLITSNGKYGNNIMTAEWTHHISYDPGILMINIHAHDATADNIKESKEFGVSIASKDQNILSSVAGIHSGKKVNKISMLEELGFEFYKAKKIDALMVSNASLNVECKLLE